MSHNLTVKSRFLILMALFVFAALLPATLAIRSAWQNMEFAKREASGLVPARQLLEVIRQAQLHRGASAVYLGGDESVLTKKQKIESDLRGAVAEFDSSIQQDNATSARVGRAWQENKSGLLDIVSAVSQKKFSGAESSKLHTKLIAELLTTLGHVADHWSLSLDPEAETYFLVIATLEQSPAMIEFMGQTRARGANLLSSKDTVSDLDRASFNGLQVQLSAAVKKTNLTFDKSADASSGASNFDLSQIVNGFKSLSEKGIDLAKRNVVDSADLSYPSSKYFSEATEIIDGMYASLWQGFSVLDFAFNERVRESRNFMIGLVAAISFTISFAAFICFKTYQAIWQQLGAEPSALREAVGRVASGDLSVQISNTCSSDSVLGAISKMQSELINIVGAVRMNAECVATASSEIAQGNLDLSQRTEMQASALQQTASTMGELGNTVNRNSENAKQANKLALEASDIASRGGAVVGEVVDTMRGINESSSRISDIIGVIDGIAFQTNILALNAAVEAARAGEQGRGFAVVATEVRSLARRSADAAREIKTLISASVDRVEQGSALVDQAGKTMVEIVDSIKRVTEIVGDISSASIEQNSGVGQIGKAILDMDQSTQQNAALVEQSAAAAESLQRQASELVEIVGTFRLGAASSLR